MVTTARTHLLFTKGGAAEALAFYKRVFDDLTVESIDYHDDDAGQDKVVRLASFTLAGQSFQCADSPGVTHEFGFTPAVSIFLDLDDRNELERIFAELAKGGGVLMPLDNYGFSDRFGWVNDRFGVSWQLNLVQP